MVGLDLRFREYSSCVASRVGSRQRGMPVLRNVQLFMDTEKEMKKPTFALPVMIVACSFIWTSSLCADDFRKQFIGSKQDQEILDKQGFVVTDQQFPQIFSAYISHGMWDKLPYFITVDSAWHTYHVLLEEGVRQLEENQAGVLLEFSSKLYDKAKAKSRQPNDEYADLARFAGVGMALQNEDAVEHMPQAYRADVERTVAGLKKPEGTLGVLFFSRPLFQERFQASSFYTKNKTLRHYFAARQWYAMCAFVLKSKEETKRALLLVDLIESDEELKTLYDRLTKPYDKLLGPTDDLDFRVYSSLARKIVGQAIDPKSIDISLDAFMNEAEALPNPKVNDQFVADRETYKQWSARTKGLRLLGPRRLPSAVVFQRTTDPIVEKRMFPSGIDFFAVGPMRSESGVRALRESVAAAKTADLILCTKGEPLPDSLHGKALKLLTLLQKPLPKSAPAPLRTSAWLDKQLWTSLGAWAEQRHTWALHAKMNIAYSRATEDPPGYVSPYPEFFRKLGALALDTCDALFGSETDRRRAAGLTLLACLKLSEERSNQKEKLRGPPNDQLQAFYRFVWQYRYLKGHTGLKMPEEESARLKEELKNIGQAWADGKQIGDTDQQLMDMLNHSVKQPAVFLPAFAKLCDSLADIAQKELNREPLNGSEAELIKDYGKMLGQFHYYGGNSWLEPRDDFPLVTPIFMHPMMGQTLYAGLAQPQALYILIEVNGRPVLHRGAVLSYREFRLPNGTVLTDEEWRKQVKSGAAPLPPSFTKSFRAGFSDKDVIESIRSEQLPPTISHVHSREVTLAMLEALRKGVQDKMFHGRLCWALIGRVADEDVLVLFEILLKSPQEEVFPIARSLDQLNWQPHVERLLAILDHDTPVYGMAAAYILSGKPKAIPVADLVAAYPSRSAHTKGFYCSVFGFCDPIPPDAGGVLLAALKDEDPSIRCQAVRAVLQGVVHRRLEVGPFAKALERMLDDPEEKVAAMAAQTLASGRQADAAPAMLSRLKKGEFKTRERWVKERFCEAFPGSGALTFRGVDRLLRHDSFIGTPSSLQRSLILGLGTLKYAPAKEVIQGYLNTNFKDDARQALMSFEQHR